MMGRIFIPKTNNNDKIRGESLCDRGADRKEAITVY
jgi:hypothetical protein